MFENVPYIHSIYLGNKVQTRKKTRYAAQQKKGEEKSLTISKAETSCLSLFFSVKN